MMFRPPDLPFEKDQSSRFLPWLIAFMVFLAAFSIAGLFVLNDLARHVGQGVGDTLTVQLPAAKSAAADAQRRSNILGLLRRTTGVRRADAISHSEVVELLRPWLGQAATSAELPLPQIIDVEIDRDSGLTAAALARRIGAQLEGVTVDDHRTWLKGLIDAIHSTEIIAVIVVLLIVLATVGTVIFTTRTGMALQREAIEILHFVGARDRYIARQFAIRATMLGLTGGVAGVAGAVPALLILGYIAGQLDSGLLPQISLRFGGWSAIGLLIPLAALIAMITARLTVLRTLAKIV